MGNWLLPRASPTYFRPRPGASRNCAANFRSVSHLRFRAGRAAPGRIHRFIAVGHRQRSDLRTCKLIDQLPHAGRAGGHDPQVTRIDAHLLNRAGVTRLCYCGNVLHARPADLLSSRELLQIGAEIYGHAGFEADLEIIQLVLETVAIAGVRNPRLTSVIPACCGPSWSRIRWPRACRKRCSAAAREGRARPGRTGQARARPARRDAQRAAPAAQPYGGPEVLKQARRELPLLPGVAAALTRCRR